MNVVIKEQPQDWRVHECTAVEFDGRRNHIYFHVEKTGLNTLSVVRELAEQTGAQRHEIGYAGRKDKHGVTRQWFSVPAECADEWPQIDGTRCLDSRYHGRKLRIGELAGNTFEITLKHCVGLEQRAEESLSEGFVNLFGPQRFASENLAKAREWLLERHGDDRRDNRLDNRRGGHRRRRRRVADGWHLSVLRSFLFNEVALYRMRQAGLPGVMDGDHLLGGYPTAPLWGRGRSLTRGAALELEAEALQPHEEICAALEFTGLRQDRRQLYVKPRQVSLRCLEQDVWLLSFALPAGSYATSCLDQHFCVRDAS